MSSAELFTSEVTKPSSIAIIGGGVASVCLADHIYQVSPNANITIFCEDNELANRGSGNKQGAIYPLLQGSKSVMAEFYASCFNYAMRYYRAELSSGLAVEHEFTGVLQQAIKPELESRLKKIAETWPEYCDYISAEQSSKIANIPLPYPSIFFNNAGWIWPQQLCLELANKLQLKFGLKIELDCKISRFEQNEGWQVYQHNNLLKGCFDAVVLCTGHQSNQFKQSAHIPLQSVRGQVSRLQPNSQLSELKTVLCHKGYITPAQSEYQCFGATFIKDDNDESIRQDEQEANLRQLKSVYQQQGWANSLMQSDIIADKAAIRAMSPDHIPIVGELFSNDWIRQNVDNNTGQLARLRGIKTGYPDSDLKNLYIYTGLGARGLTSAPLLSKHLANLMFGISSPLDKRLQKAINSKRFQVRLLKKKKNLF